MMAFVDESDTQNITQSQPFHAHILLLQHVIIFQLFEDQKVMRKSFHSRWRALPKVTQAV